MLDIAQTRFFKKMESTVSGLQLQRKIIFVSCNAGKYSSVLHRRHNDTSALPQVFVGICDDIAKFPGRLGRSINRKVGCDESSCAIHHVAFGAACLYEK